MRVPPRSGAAVAWINAWSSGRCAPDDADAGITGDDALHRVVLPGAPEPVPWTLALGRLRGDGTLAARVALPVPGDPAGLVAPPPEVLAAGEAVVLRGLGLLLVPAVATSGRESVVRWDAVPGTETSASTAADLGVAAADRALREALRETAEVMESLALDRPRPDVSRRLASVERALADQHLPGTVDQRAIVLLRTAGRLLAAVEMALEDEGAAVTAGEAHLRRAALLPLTAACRRALEAAYGGGDGGSARG